MHLEARFRLSIYLTLLLASACLGFTEEAFLPGMLLFLIPVGMLIVLAYIVEGRWALSVFAAHVVGTLIAIGWGCWLAFHFVHPADFVKNAPGATVIVPYIGPLLMVLMIAWLFRQKETYDFWGLHIGACIEVTLACVLASEPVFAALLLVYLASALWSLSLFHLCREEQRLDGVRVGESSSLPAWFACRWAVVASAFAALLFLCTPQGSDSTWDPFRLARTKPIEVGYAQAIDLAQTGQLRLSNEIAFEVTAQNADGTPKLDLSEATRWRGAVLEHYDKGVWLAPVPLMTMPPPEVALPAMRRSVRPRPPRVITELPDLGPSQFFITFDMSMRQLRGMFLAEPVIVQREDRPPVIPVNAEEQPWRFHTKDWTLSHAAEPTMALQTTWSYKQVTLPPESDLNGPVAAQVAERGYLQQPVARIRSWTLALLRELHAREDLADGDFQWLTGAVLYERREKVARALCRYLATSREFGYTLNLRRKDRMMDPIEDFLVNVKDGHCERYAAALALMLRSCGIPARIVVGFRGAESESNDGRYVVRESAAHSWVEALVYHPDENGTLHEHWLSLDPTPSSDAAESGKTLWSGGWQGLIAGGEMAWRGFIVDYNSERQAEAVEPLVIGLRKLARRAKRLPGELRLWLACALVALAGAGLLWRRWRPRWPAWATRNRCEVPCYDRLLALLARHLRLTPLPTQTPREFALAASTSLRAGADTALFADVPVVLADLLYRVRYGQVPLQDREHADAERRVHALGLCLASSYKHS